MHATHPATGAVAAANATPDGHPRASGPFVRDAGPHAFLTTG